MVNTTRMLAQLHLHEGVRLVPYHDVLGNETIGVGYNVAARGWEEFSALVQRDLASDPWVSAGEADRQCLADITRVQAAVRAHASGFFDGLNEVRQRVCVDLAFNIGFRALGFKKCIAAIERQDWSTAAVELHKAHWAQQVQPSADLSADAVKIYNEKIQGRADRLARMLLTGADYVA